MGWAVSDGSDVKSTQSNPFRSRSKRWNSDGGMSVRTGLLGLKKNARIKFDLRKRGNFIIFKDKINYLYFSIENIELVLDKIEKVPIILLETQREY